MADATPARLGQDNLGGSTDALFLKVFANEVLEAFYTANIMKPLTLNRSIPSGKSATFPVTAKVAASYHTVGSEIVGQTVAMSEKVIVIDDKLIAPVFVGDLDEMKNHFDYRSIYKTAIGQALARVYDQRLLQVTILAARAAATITGGTGNAGGTVITQGALATDGSAIADTLHDAASVLDVNNVPEAGRHVVLLPTQYHLLARTPLVLNSFTGGSGSFRSGQTYEVAGFTVHKSNNVPTTVIASAAGDKNTYDGTFTNTVGAIFHEGAVGTLSLMDLAMQSEYDIRRQGTLMVASMAVGHGILRPESAIELKTA